MIPELAEYLARKGWDYSEVQGGSQVQLNSECPFCGKKKKLFFNAENGLWNCFYAGCPKNDLGGNLISLRRELGDLDARVMPSHMVYSPSKKGAKITMKAPVKTPAKGLDDRCHRDLLDTPDVLEYMTKVRGFSEETLSKFKVGFVKKGGNRLVSYPFYVDGHLVNIKFRTVPPAKKDFRRVKGCQSTLFNQDSLADLDQIPAEERIAFVLESETDCMALHQLGFNRCVASSAGAGSWSQSWLAPLEDATEIFLPYDNDEAGEAGSSKVADMLGRYRCKRVLPKLHDVAEMLSAGMTKADMQECIDDARPYEDGTVKPTSAFAAELKAELMSPKPRGRPTGWSTLDALWGGVRDAELTVVTGDTGSGKSTWTTQFAYNRALYGEPVLIAPFEMKPKHVLGKIVSMRSGISIYDMPISDLDVHLEQIDALPIRWVDAYGTMSLDALKDALYMAVRRFGVRFAVLDHLHYFLEVEKFGEERFKIDKAMKSLASWTKDTGLHIFLVVHPHQLQADNKGNVRKPDLHNLKGASSIKQETDNAIRVHRYRNTNRTGKPGATVTVLKCRSPAGTEGSIQLDFDLDSELYTEAAPRGSFKDYAAGEDRDDEEAWSEPI